MKIKYIKGTTNVLTDTIFRLVYNNLPDYHHEPKGQECTLECTLFEYLCPTENAVTITQTYCTDNMSIRIYEEHSKTEYKTFQHYRIRMHTVNT